MSVPTNGQNERGEWVTPVRPQNPQWELIFYRLESEILPKLRELHFHCVTLDVTLKLRQLVVDVQEMDLAVELTLAAVQSLLNRCENVPLSRSAAQRGQAGEF